MEIKKFSKNFSLMKNFKSFSMPRKSKNLKQDFLGLKSPVARPWSIEHDFKIKKLIYTLGLLVLIFLILYFTASLITNYTGFGVSDLIK